MLNEIHNVTSHSDSMWDFGGAMTRTNLKANYVYFESKRNRFFLFFQYF